MILTTPHLLGQHYVYAIGRLGALEDQLLKVTDIDRLLGASDGAEAVKMLRDIEFVATPDVEEPFQKTLNSTTALLKETVERMIPEQKHFIFDVLWIEFDRARIAYELKEKNGFTSQIASPPEPPVSASFAPEFDREFSSPQEIDDAVAVAVNDQKLILARRSGSKLICEFVEKMTELDALRTKMRSEKSDVETIAFEKEGLAQLSDLLDDMQKLMLGPEATFSYTTRALSHIQLLKVLLTGKVNNLPIQEIKSLLPPLV